MNCIPSFHLLITSWQYSLTTPFWLSRTLCANQLQKNHIPLAAGRPSETQNHTKQMIPFPSISLPDSVILCCIFQHQPWTKLFSNLMLLLSENLHKTFVYYFRGYLHWTPDSPCVCIEYIMRPTISAFLLQWHKSLLFIYTVGQFFNFCGTLGRGGTSLTKRRQQNAKYWPFQLKNRREKVYTNPSLSSATANEFSHVSHSHA